MESRSGRPNESWEQYYQQNVFLGSTMSSMTQDIVSEATVVTTSPFSNSTEPHSINQHHLERDSPRVSRPIRRRARASRQTPTTLLNTDPKNFRAMVQQFTGGHANTSSPYPSPISSSHHSQLMAGPNSINFGNLEGNRRQNLSSEAAYLQFVQLRFQQQQQQQQHQQQQEETQAGHGSNDLFLLAGVQNSGSDVDNSEPFRR